MKLSMILTEFVILATQEAAIRRIKLQSQLGKIVHETVFWKYLTYTHKKRASGVAQSVGSRVKNKTKKKYIYICIYTHTHTHTHIYIHICVLHVYSYIKYSVGTEAKITLLIGK
jgi:hypothetical protein